MHLDIKRHGQDVAIAELLTKMDMWDHVAFANNDTGGVILKDELAGKRRSGVQRDRCGLGQILIAEGTDGSHGGGAVLLQKFERGLFADGAKLFGMPGIHVVDGIHRDAGDGLAFGQLLRQLNLQRVDAGDVMNDDSDGAAIPWQRGAPLRIGKRAG
jgi:hypothetical protein